MKVDTQFFLDHLKNVEDRRRFITTYQMPRALLLWNTLVSKSYHACLLLLNSSFTHTYQPINLASQFEIRTTFSPKIQLLIPRTFSWVRTMLSWPNIRISFLTGICFRQITLDLLSMPLRVVFQADWFVLRMSPGNMILIWSTKWLPRRLRTGSSSARKLERQ